ncbi:hypothetical protein ACQUJS_15050 [Ralstonia pseudosolanacearum]|uniref:hypothetical protein n=1 Tax=Ralstonia pseudosolanacearum TaxID=1310165 RepID=UPI000B079054|nr:hypothetical protein [Ralstonia pseudosolanacearum]
MAGRRQPENAGAANSSAARAIKFKNRFLPANAWNMPGGSADCDDFAGENNGLSVGYE